MLFIVLSWSRKHALEILYRRSRQTLEGNGMKDRHLTLNRSHKIEKSLILFLIRIPNLTAP